MLVVLALLYLALVASDIVLTIKKLKRQGLATELNIWVRYWSKQLGLVGGVVTAIGLESLLILFVPLFFWSTTLLAGMVGFRLCLFAFQCEAESLTQG